MGFYSAMMDHVAAMADRLEHAENLWRVQEAKVLTVTALCAAIENDADGKFLKAFDTVCSLLESEPQLQSPMIMRALDDAAKNAKIPAIATRAVQCRLRTDWSIAQDDIKHYVTRMSHDNWITEDNERHAQSRRTDIAAAEKLLGIGGEAQRNEAVDRLLKFSTDPVSAPRVREVFAASATSEARAALDKIPSIQSKAAAEIAATIGKPLIIPRPCRSITR